MVNSFRRTLFRHTDSTSRRCSDSLPLWHRPSSVQSTTISSVLVHLRWDRLAHLAASLQQDLLLAKDSSSQRLDHCLHSKRRNRVNLSHRRHRAVLPRCSTMTNHPDKSLQCRHGTNHDKVSASRRTLTRLFQVSEVKVASLNSRSECQTAIGRASASPLVMIWSCTGSNLYPAVASRVLFCLASWRDSSRWLLSSKTMHVWILWT
mmetsp:Transcript_12786/g.28169  ORF Transcript_12786/g.28169 Transcript_12786/m.28169 type:complete len:206 (+) Transcript_12786:2817-3434(+)